MQLRQRWGWLAHVFKACTQQHHKDQAHIFAPLIPADGIVLDVGAHAGQFAKLFARMAPKGRVYAFEPSPYALSILTRAIRFNRLKNVVIEPQGLSDQPGVARLSTPIKRSGGLGFGIAHLGEDKDDARQNVAYEVRLTTIDTICRDFHRLDLIKIDVEGWELSALRGGEETIRRFRPAIFAEVNEHHLARAGTSPEQMWAYLQGLGYKATRNGEPAPTYTEYGDYLWLPSA